ncbi:MAG: endonuclease/exonuclease/phosphatase family protein [Mariprofundaceae bacterium]
MSALRLLTFNIQAGIGSHRPRHALTHGWRYLLPHRQRERTLERIARAIEAFDLVGLQEADAGSLRSRFVHQQESLACRAGFGCSQSLITREIPPLARISLGLLARLPLHAVRRHRLPASRHGRGALEAEIVWQGARIGVVVTHLSLSQRSRIEQMRHLARILNRHERAILMGDLNCRPESLELRTLIAHTRLRPPKSPQQPTHPSWSPRRKIDYILATNGLRLSAVRTRPLQCSDHLPLAAEVRLAPPA